MRKLCRFLLLLSAGLCLPTFLASSVAQDAPKPLNAAEIVALVAGRSLPVSITHAIRSPGVVFSSQR